MLTCFLVGALSFWTFVEVPVAFLLVGKMKLSYERWWERLHVESIARGWGAAHGLSSGSTTRGAGVAPHRVAVHSCRPGSDMSKEV